MKKKSLTRALVSALIISAVAIVPAFSGCTGEAGRDGRDGNDLSIYEIWQETKTQTNNPDLTYEEFLHTYLSFDFETLQNSVLLQSSINRSLMTGVSIVTTFIERVHTFFGYTEQEASYYGSGVILDIDKESGDMTVVTNCHVVYSAAARTENGTLVNSANGFAKSVKLWLYGGEFLENEAIDAQIVGASKSYDLAVLKVSGSDVVKRSYASAAAWCEDEEATVGEIVYTVGNADGKKLSSTVGYVSKDSEAISLDMGSSSRSEVYEYRVLRTDSAINGGNSGGGLYNKDGELVGIINAKTISQQVDNMGYALPAATTRRVVEKLKNSNGNLGVEIAYSGFTYEATDSYSTGLNSSGVAEIKETVRVGTVSISGAANGKIESKDVILSVKVGENEPIYINRVHNLTDALISVNPGDTVIFTVLRDGQEIDVAVTYATADFMRKA